MATQTLEINKQNALKAYNEATPEQKKLLVSLFGEETFFQKITDRVKTFEDACSVIGGLSENQKVMLAYNGNDELVLSSIAYLKLSIIAKALNEGWKANWSISNEYKYYPWFKKNPSGSGLVFFDVDYWFTLTCVGSRLCFKNEDLAEYAGKQFIDVYSDWMNLE